MRTEVECAERSLEADSHGFEGRQTETCTWGKGKKGVTWCYVEPDGTGREIGVLENPGIFDVVVE